MFLSVNEDYSASRTQSSYFDNNLLCNVQPKTIFSFFSTFTRLDTLISISLFLFMVVYASAPKEVGFFPILPALSGRLAQLFQNQILDAYPCKNLLQFSFFAARKNIKTILSKTSIQSGCCLILSRFSLGSHFSLNYPNTQLFSVLSKVNLNESKSQSLSLPPPTNLTTFLLYMFTFSILQQL